MARSRNIKPGFFLNDELALVEPLGRILFAGLWCIADREGRLEDRPRRIKAEVLPYDNCNLGDLLNQLAKQGFIVRYKVDGEPYIQVTNFSKHQNPHKNERDSDIPPPEHSDTSTGQAPDRQATSAELVSADSEVRKKQAAKKAISHGPLDDSHTSTIQAPEHSDTNPADSLLLIPDSCTRRTNSPRRADDNNVNEDLKKIIKAFEADIHLLPSSTEVECLAGWLDDGMDPDLIVFAIKQAAWNSARKISYIDAVLRNLKAENITSLKVALERERDRKQAQQAKQSGQGESRAREPTLPPLSPEDKKRNEELIRKLAEEMSLDVALENKTDEEVPPWLSEQEMG